MPPTPIAPPWPDRVADLQQVARTNNHRCGLILCGEQNWCVDAARVITSGDSEAVLWIGRHTAPGMTTLSVSQAGRVLGRGFDTVIFDGWSGFNVDALGAVSGTVRGGGLLCLLMPPGPDWATYPDPERTRIAAWGYVPAAVAGRWFRFFRTRVLETAAVLTVTQDGAVEGTLPPVTGLPPASVGPEGDPDCLTPDQAAGVAAVIRASEGKRRKPGLLVSDRGRGKSAALGIAASRLLQQGRKRIFVTAPSRNSVVTLFDHAARLLPGARRTATRIELGETHLEYLAPDRVISRADPADMVMVDEAAGIPLPGLAEIIQHCSRLALATTVHGYEGTGRGFELRLSRHLADHSRGLRRVKLTTPVRWAENDPVERFVFRALLLDADPGDSPTADELAATECATGQLERDALAADPALLEQIFGLLVASHYRTRPSDLRYLLDAPGVSIHVSRTRGRVMAAALVADEGGFDRDTAREIVDGRRRPRGHLVPESLGAHLGMADAPQLRYRRVVRIAVREDARRRGLARQLIGAVSRSAGEAGVDCLGVSYAADPGLMAFWHSVGFSPVRLGITRGAASGERSLMMLKPVSVTGKRLVVSGAGIFWRRLPEQLADPARTCDPRLVLALLEYGPPAVPPDTESWYTTAGFAFGRRGYEDSIAELVAVARYSLSASSGFSLDDSGRIALAVRVLQKRSWSECARVLNLTGRRDVLDRLREAFGCCCVARADPALQTEIARLKSN